MTSELRLRIISGIVLAIIALGATWAGGLPFQALSVVIALLIFYEWSTMTRLPDVDIRGCAFGWLALVVVCGLVLFGDGQETLLVLAGAVIVASAWVMIRATSWWLPGGIAYAGLAGISLAEIRGDNHLGLIAMLFVFAVVWATDILAYSTLR